MSDGFNCIWLRMDPEINSGCGVAVGCIEYNRSWYRDQEACSLIGLRVELQGGVNADRWTRISLRQRRFDVGVEC